MQGGRRSGGRHGRNLRCYKYTSGPFRITFLLLQPQASDREAPLREAPILECCAFVLQEAADASYAWAGPGDKHGWVNELFRLRDDIGRAGREVLSKDFATKQRLLEEGFRVLDMATLLHAYASQLGVFERLLERMHLSLVVVADLADDAPLADLLEFFTAQEEVAVARRDMRDRIAV